MDQFWTAVGQAVLGLASAVIATLCAIYGPKLVAAFEKWTNTKFTEEQRQIILSAAQTAAGNIETAIDQKRMSIGDVHPSHKIVTKNVDLISARPPVANAMVALNMTTDYLAHIVVGKVNTGTRTAVAVETTPPPPEASPIRVISP